MKMKRLFPEFVFVLLVSVLFVPNVFAEKITNTFTETDVRNALRIIACDANVMLISGDDVEGCITVDFNDVEFEKVLNMITSTLGLTWKEMDNYYLVGRADPTDSPIFHQLSETEVVRLNYISPETFVKMTSDFFKPFVKATDDSSSIIITASPEMIARIKKDVAEFDKKPRQVMIQAIIIDVSRSDAEEYGIDWDYTWGEGVIDEHIHSLSLGGMTLGFESFGAEQILSSLQALHTKGAAKIKANPRVMVMDCKKATISITMDQYFSIPRGSIYYANAEIEVIKSGVELTVDPRINKDDTIYLTVIADVSDSIGEQQYAGNNMNGNGENILPTQALPVINTRRVESTFHVRNNETIILGGLLQTVNRTELKKVPLLGDIPILDLLFKHKIESKVEKEVIILLTPHILGTPMPEPIDMDAIEREEMTLKLNSDSEKKEGNERVDSKKKQS